MGVLLRLDRLVVEPARPFGPPGFDGEAASHAQVGDQGLAGVERRGQVLGPAAERQDLGPGQPLGEPLGEWKAQVGTALVHPGQPGALQVRGQAPAHGLDLGQLGHAGDIGRLRGARQGIPSANIFL